jgi:hypothetical protein
VERSLTWECNTARSGGQSSSGQIVRKVFNSFVEKFVEKEEQARPRPNKYGF